MKRLVSFCLLFLPLAAWAQKQYFLPTATLSDEGNDKPMIEVYLPQQPNGCAVVLCPGTYATRHEDAADGGCNTSLLL